MKRLFVWLQYLLPQHLLSRTIGWLANQQIVWMKNLAIRTVIRHYNVDMSDAKRQHPDEFRSFNDFFTRTLTPGTRPIEGRISSPSDGMVAAVGNIRSGTLLQAKGVDYSLQQLLGEADVSRFDGGSFLTIYLAPRDYHRVHFPVACRVSRSRYIPGSLFSVNADTAAQVKGLFARNERMVLALEADDPMALVMVGAMIVAAVKPVWRDAPYPPGRFVEEQPDLEPFEQGSELGLFEMGSTVILVTERREDWTVSTGDVIRMGQNLVGESRRQTE